MSVTKQEQKCDQARGAGLLGGVLIGAGLCYGYQWFGVVCVVLGALVFCLDGMLSLRK